ncbi:sulfurtransferase-like selenium metabolism protein YedF [Campylobacter geochelonis]|uniref:Translation initiation factor IF-3 n=1 Tax=Campylobacter geochelonis TaxID=1780362 RepID=A0A128E9W4_9BACT|nr:sulfurtransferase-like selenium metabolism protein YedF [Campylobacter geochelonis]QKF72019.1 selenium metabolism protein [Campylobacter geochelonis]CZE45729.1 translation initiation factor IF-3 [Campylobacter geochelonis]CZE46896.1 translation initiation factor IF-3 [Campylobacter geochelonis]CZE49895.1 translation initiation factor IF-3 [Campylobacter geochelonis]
MQIDCRNLACPEPVIKTKNALNSLKIGQTLEILVNDIAPKENIKRFLSKNSLSYELSQNNDETTIKTVKTNELKNTSTDEYACEVANLDKQKVIYLNEESAGSGAVGKGLLSKFLLAMLNLETKPKAVICVNSAVFMTTDRAHVSYQALKNLEANGVEIYSCGSCLEAYKVVDKLSVGNITNAYEIMEMLSSYEVIKL